MFLLLQVPGVAGAASLLLAVCEWLQSFLETRWEATGENLPEQQVHKRREKWRDGQTDGRTGAYAGGKLISDSQRYRK